MIRTTPGVPDSVDILFFDSRGADLSAAAQRKLDRVFSRQEYRRAFPGEIGDLTFPPRTIEAYSHELMSRIDVSGIADADLKVVVDAAGGAASLVLPSLLGRLGVDAYTVNVGMDEAHPTESAADRRAALTRLASWSRRRRLPSVCGSTRLASGSRWSTRRAR